MIDREKVIKGLECCIANMHNNCPYKSTDEGIDKVTSCTTYLMKDALALLKEQKAEYEKGFNDAMLGKQELMYEGIDGKWHKKDW